MTDQPTEPFGTVASPQPDRSGPPAWLLPAGIGAVVAILLVLLVVVLTGGDDSTVRTADDSTPASSDAPSASTDPPTTTEPADSAEAGSAEGSPNGETGDGNGAVAAPPPPTASGGPTTCASYRSNEQLPLVTCDQGQFVTSAQQALAAFGIDVDADGFFGPGTESAVRDFQDRSGLPADGVIGDDTWEALCPYSTTLCEPDGDPVPSVQAGISIDGVGQNVLYECSHLPFQRRDGGVADAHVSGDTYLVDDPTTGARRTVGLWIEDGTRVLVVSSLSSAGVGQVDIPFDEPVAQTVDVGGEQLFVTADVAAPSIPCDTFFTEGPDGEFVAYGVVDVCSAGQDRVFTLAPWWDMSFRHAYSELLVSVDGDPVSGAVGNPQLRLAGEYVSVTSIQRDVGASNEFFGGSFDRDGASWTFAVAIDSYPEGGHDCVGGQITD